MQVMMNKNEPQLQQPTSQQLLQVDIKITMKKLLEELERGKQSAIMMRVFLLTREKLHVVDNKNDVDHDQGSYKALDHYSMMALDTYNNAISMLKSFDFDGVFVSEIRKLDHHLDGVDVMSLDNDHCTSLESTDDQGSPRTSTIFGRRAKYYNKRRLIGDSRTETVTHLTDDGFTWRKYGRKVILNSVHPRHYYRCMHRKDQNCQATKQVQQVSNKPTKYKVIYHFDHTCQRKTPAKTSPSSVIDFPGDHPSSIVLRFDQTNHASPILFPTSTTFSSEVTTAVDQNAISNHASEQINDFGLKRTVEEDYSLIMDEFSDLLPDHWKI